LQEYRLTRQDWAILTTVACFKFIITAFYLVALITILRNQRIELEKISWVWLLAIVEAAKAIVAPLLERFYWQKVGRFKTWLLATNVIFCGLFGLLYFLQPARDFDLLLLICVGLTLTSLFFGCAALGLTCALLPQKQRGFGGIMQVIGARLGKMLGGALILLIYQHYGWQAAIGTMLAFSFGLLVQIAFYREPTFAPAAQQFALGYLFKRLINFWREIPFGRRWLFFLLFSCVPYSLMATIFIPKLTALAWQPQHIGILLSAIVPVAGVIVTPFSGWLLQKYSRHSLLRNTLCGQIILIAIFYYLEPINRADFIAYPILLFSVSYSFLLPIVMTMLLDRAVFPTVDTALQLSVALIGAYIAGFCALRLIGVIDYRGVYVVAFLMTLILWRTVDGVVKKRG